MEKSKDVHGCLIKYIRFHNFKFGSLINPKIWCNSFQCSLCPQCSEKNILMSARGFHLTARNVCITPSPARRNKETIIVARVARWADCRIPKNKGSKMTSRVPQVTERTGIQSIPPRDIHRIHVLWVSRYEGEVTLLSEFDKLVPKIIHTHSMLCIWSIFIEFPHSFLEGGGPKNSYQSDSMKFLYLRQNGPHRHMATASCCQSHPWTEDVGLEDLFTNLHSFGPGSDRQLQGFFVHLFVQVFYGVHLRARQACCMFQYAMGTLIDFFSSRNLNPKSNYQAIERLDVFSQQAVATSCDSSATRMVYESSTA